MNVEFRSVIHCCWLDNDSIQETYQKMQRAYGTHCPSESLVRKWFKEFEDGRIDVYDLPRSGRPKLFEKVDEVKKVIDEFPFASCRYIAHIINIDKNTVKRILIEDLHMKKVLFRWVPKNFDRISEKNESRTFCTVTFIIKFVFNESNQKGNHSRRILVFLILHNRRNVEIWRNTTNKTKAQNSG